MSILLHPKSSGTVKLLSKDPFDKPIIDPNLFSHPDDFDTMIEGNKNWEQSRDFFHLMNEFLDSSRYQVYNQR